MLCMVVLLFAMTTGVMGCYQKDPDPIEVPSGTSEVEATPIPTVNRQAELAERHEAHRACGYLPAVFKVEQGDGVKPHVAVVVHGEREGEAAVVDKVVVPFLDAHFARLDVGTAVYRQQLFGVAGLGEVSFGVKQGNGAGDLVLHFLNSLSRPDIAPGKVQPEKFALKAGAYLRTVSFCKLLFGAVGADYHFPPVDKAGVYKGVERAD